MKVLAYIAARPLLRNSLAYFAFAGVWAIFSHFLLFSSLSTSPGFTFSSLLAFNIAAFILASVAVFYWLFRHDLWFEKFLVFDGYFLPLALFTILGVVITACAWGLFDALRQTVRYEAQQSLIVSGKLKANQIENWLAERQADLMFDAADVQSSQMVARWMRTPNASNFPAEVRLRFETLKRIHGYSAIEVYDLDGVPRFGDEPGADRIESEAARRVAASGGPVLVDFHREMGTGPISFGLMVPIRANGVIQGAIFAAFDPTRFLYPLMQEWPGLGRTGETLLLRRDGDYVVYLSELRYYSHAPLSLKKTMDNTHFAVVQAAMGSRGVLSDVLDYRNKPVLGYVSEIQGTPWLMLAKIDEAEAYSEVNRIAFFSVSAAVLLVGFCGWGIWLWWRGQQERFETMRKQEALDRQLLETSYNALSKYANDMILIADEAGRLVQVNDRTSEMLGYSQAELNGMDVRLLSASTTLDGKEVRALVREGARRYEIKCRRKDGSIFPVEVSARLIEQGRRRFIHIVARDVTERKQAEESMQLATLVYQHSSEAMMVTDTDGNILSVNPAFTRVTGYSAEEAIGRPTRIFNSGRQDKDFYQSLWRGLKTKGHWEGEIWNRRKNGEIFAEWLSINAIRNEDGTAQRFVALFTDITQKKKNETLIWQQANFDQLTGLPNRRMFHDRLEQEIKKAHRNGMPLALMFIDLDRFKEVNDTLGHDMGDLLLKETALRLQGCVRNSDTVARLGGDEFTIILADLEDAGNVERVARCLLHKLADPFQLGVETVYVSASIGVTLYPEDGMELSTLLKNADQAMYAAKHEGRNRFNYFTPSMQEAAQARMIMAHDLRVALAEGQMRVHYQPIVDLASGEIRKAEALLRWQHPKRGLLNPSDFLAVAQETGIIMELGDWIFHQAAQQAVLWQASHKRDFQVCINKSATQFCDDSDHRHWIDYLRQIGLPGQSLAVEITEDLLLADNPTVAAKLAAFHEAGVQISLDDFGTGYSALSYLRKFDIDYLKIDPSFVHNLDPGSEAMALCEAIIVMAHKLGIQVIAEGVETPVHRDLLAAVHCDYVQGFIFSRPLPAEEFEKLLK